MGERAQVRSQYAPKISRIQKTPPKISQTFTSENTRLIKTCRYPIDPRTNSVSGIWFVYHMTNKDNMDLE